MTNNGFDQTALATAEQQMRLVLLGTGALTLEQVNRHAPGLTRAVVGAYLYEVEDHQPSAIEQALEDPSLLLEAATHSGEWARTEADHLTRILDRLQGADLPQGGAQ